MQSNRMCYLNWDVLTLLVKILIDRSMNFNEHRQPCKHHQNESTECSMEPRHSLEPVRCKTLPTTQALDE